MKTEDKIRKKVEVGSFVISNIWRIMAENKGYVISQKEETEENGGVEKETTSARKNIQ